MRYYISDLHFFHKKLLTTMDKRAFENVEEMHEYIIKRWNRKINRKDDVVILGDVSFGKAEETSELLKKLNGRLYLVRGNHDNAFLKKKTFDESVFEWIKDYAELDDNKRRVVLCHYPIMCYNGQYRLDDEGKPKTYMLYGHVHDTHDQRFIEKFAEIMRTTEITREDGRKERISCNMINCFCKYSDYTPFSLDEWIAYWKL